MTIHKPLHPGEIVKEILIEGAELSVNEASMRLDVNRTTLSRLINGHIALSPDMALRLSKLLTNTSMSMWMNLQRDYDIWQMTHKRGKYHIRPLDKAA